MLLKEGLYLCMRVCVIVKIILSEESLYIYIYIGVCVCVCVCVWYFIIFSYLFIKSMWNVLKAMPLCISTLAYRWGYAITPLNRASFQLQNSYFFTNSLPLFFQFFLKPWTCSDHKNTQWRRHHCQDNICFYITYSIRRIHEDHLIGAFFISCVDSYIDWGFSHAPLLPLVKCITQHLTNLVAQASGKRKWMSMAAEFFSAWSHVWLTMWAERLFRSRIWFETI